jgi:formylglycine-generating enzyme required for sulfatase activity
VSRSSTAVYRPVAEAMARFHDRTGRPGPATWGAGRFPDGLGRFPVGGVSWYEAAAYAAFVGRSLPTMHHWYRAAALDRFADILGVSNFDAHGPAPVGDRGGLGPFGTEDMAGNVKEWYSTEVGGKRGLLGGAWDDQRDVFVHLDRTRRSSARPSSASASPATCGRCHRRSPGPSRSAHSATDGR